MTKYNLKKYVFFILLFFVLSFNPIFGSSNNLNLNGNVETEDYKLSLLYHFYKKPVQINNSFEINKRNGQPFNLNNKGRTKLFGIFINGNQNHSSQINIEITTNPFKPIIDLGKYKDSDFVETPIAKEKTRAIPTGLVEDYLYYSFYIKWEGKQDLTSGLYSSDIIINYSIE